jgi:hypothetical protein
MAGTILFLPLLVAVLAKPLWHCGSALSIAASVLLVIA